MTPTELRRALAVIVLTLLCLGVLAVCSASGIVAQATYGSPGRFVTQHLLAIACGLAVGLACLALPYPALRRAARWLLPVSLLLLLAVCIAGQEVGGAKRWFRLGRLSVQPSEFAQLSLVLYLAERLSRTGPDIRAFWRGVAPPLAVTGLTAGLVLLQPDLGTAVAMGTMALLLLFVAKARWQHVIGVLAVAGIALILLIGAAEYRRQRILSFLNPWSDPRGSGYQILQSYVALAGGGLVGLGVGGSLQKLFYLPSAHTDFIFAIIGEELGLVGTTAIIVLFGLLLTCGLRIAQATQDRFGKYLVVGLIGTLVLEAMVNMAVVTGLVPTKGLPLPLVSYGGSSMIMNLVACALIFHVGRHGLRAGGRKEAAA